jgi:hypothetical protein
MVLLKEIEESRRNMLYCFPVTVFVLYVTSDILGMDGSKAVAVLDFACIP